MPLPASSPRQPIERVLLQDGVQVQGQHLAHHARKAVGQGAFTQPGLFTVTQTVTGPGGTDSVSATVGVDTAPGLMMFNPVSAVVVNEEFLVQLEGASGVTPVVILMSTNLVEWTPIATNAPRSGAFRLTNAVLPDLPGEFFRAMRGSPGAAAPAPAAKR